MITFKQTIAAQLIITTSIVGVIAVPSLSFAGTGSVIPDSGNLPSDPESLKCSVLPQQICDQAKTDSSGGNVENTGIFALLKEILKILTTGIGIVAVGAVAYAGILYSSAGDNQSQVQQSKQMIKNVAIGIATYAMMFMGINWLIPGGVFG